MKTDYFRALAKLAIRRWEASAFDAKCFHQIATAVLTDMPPHEHVDLEAIVALAFGKELPEQLDPESRFGEPPLTVYNDGRIVVDVYFWMRGTMSIHQHAFAGAFAVLEGSSIEALYEFDETVRYSENVRGGACTVKRTRLNRKGDCHGIQPGKGCIHSLFHLDRPSASVVMRTDAPWAVPQFEYWWPSLAVTPLCRLSPQLRRRVQLLELLARIEHPHYEPTLISLLGQGEPEVLVWGLSGARPFFAGRAQRFNALLGDLERRHGSLVHRCALAFKQEAGQVAIIAARRVVTERRALTLLGILLNARSRTDVTELWRDYFPDDGTPTSLLHAFAIVFSSGTPGVTPPPGVSARALNAALIDSFGWCGDELRNRGTVAVEAVEMARSWLASAPAFRLFSAD